MFRLKGKRLLALILVSVLALVFTVGCQKQSAAPEGTPGETPKDTGWPKRIAIGAASPGGGFTWVEVLQRPLLTTMLMESTR